MRLMNDQLNLELSQCVKTISNVGNTIYQDICDGGVNVVPWGSADWLAFLFLMFVILMLILGVRMVINDHKLY